MKEISYHLKTNYISEDKELLQLIDETAKEHQVILLVAPQGTGKSYLLQKLKNSRKIISPTRALTNQYRENSRDRYGRTTYYTSTFASSRTSGGMIDEVVEYLIIDEIHKAVQYSSFAYEQTSKTLDTFNEAFDKGQHIILTTATPELLECLQGYRIYDSIEVVIKISTNKKYLEKVCVMDNYTKNKIEKLVMENHEQNPGLQIVLINDTDAVENVAEYFNNNGLNAIGITANNRTDGIEKEIFEKITKNLPIDYNVLIATSWIDVGMNFVNENITYIYCMFDNEYSRGDFTLLWQFMARARNCKPVFYITKPILSEQEKRLIKYIMNQRENERIRQKLPFDLASVLQEARNELLKQDGFELLQLEAKNAIRKFYEGICSDRTLRTVEGIVFDDKFRDKFNYSPIPIRYYLHKIIEKINFNEMLVKKMTNCDNIDFYTINFEAIDDCTNDEVIEIRNYFISMILRQQEFEQEEIVENINRITQKVNSIRQLATFIKKCNFEMKLLSRKSGSKKYYRLFFDWDINHAMMVSNHNDWLLSEIGFAKYTREQMERIKEIKTAIKIYKNITKTVEEYFIDISTLDHPYENRELSECLLLVDLKEEGLDLEDVI